MKLKCSLHQPQKFPNVIFHACICFSTNFSSFCFLFEQNQPKNKTTARKTVLGVRADPAQAKYDGKKLRLIKVNHIRAYCKATCIYRNNVFVI